MKLKKFLTTMLMALAAANLTAEPFGLEMGWTFDQIVESGAIPSDVSESEDGIFCTLEVTKPHPLVDLYMASIDHEFGLYWIQAIALSDNADESGKGTRDLYNLLHFQLSEKYGEPIAEVKYTDYPSFDYDNWLSEIEAGKGIIACWGGNGNPEIDTILLSPEIFHGVGVCAITYNGINGMDIRRRENQAGIDAL